jgi:phosphate uptake regulator
VLFSENLSVFFGIAFLITVFFYSIKLFLAYMKRNVILMGGKTHVVSLPSKWIKKYNIQKGEELNIEEIGDSIIVKTGKNVKGDELIVNVENLEKMLGRTVGAIYKSGYDQAKIVYDNEDQLKVIENTLQRTCIGFEIVKQGEGFVIVKNLASTDKEEFDTALKRIFFSLEIMGNNLFDAKNKEELMEVIKKDDQVNKLSDFCRRILNKGEIKLIVKPNVVYYLVEQLERVGDVYKKLAKYAIDNQMSVGSKKLLRDINLLLVYYREMFYCFKLDNVEEFYRMFEFLSGRLADFKEKGYSEDLLLQEFLLEYIFDLNGALVTIKL